MRVLWLMILTACSDGVDVTSVDGGLGPTPLNPVDTLANLRNPPKCELPSPEQLASMHTKSIAITRIAAEDGFDSVNAVFEEVKRPMPDVRACKPTPYHQKLTNAAAHQAKGVSSEPYRHLTALTFVPDRRLNANSRARGDLYLHGTQGEPSHLVLRDVDFRKYLYQDIVLHDCETDSELCDPERTPGVGNEWKGAEVYPKAFQNQPFNATTFQCIRNVHGYFAEFNRITKKIGELSQVDAPSSRLFHLTNNCREPGNYELALVSGEHGKLWGNHVSLDIDFYASILKELEVDYQALGTGVRIVGAEKTENGAYQYEVKEKKVFPENCHIANLAPYIGKGQQLLGTHSVVAERGDIPWSEYASETQAKSGLKSDEGIVYVAVQSSGEEPANFEAKGFYFAQAEDGAYERLPSEEMGSDWAALRSQAAGGKTIYAPHTFATFADVADYPFQISAFEVDGRYLGRLKPKRIAAKASRMYRFDYSFLQDLTTAEVRQTVEQNGEPDGDIPRLEFRLLNQTCGTEQDCVNLILGNLQLKPGEKTNYVLGIGTQPLRDLYVNNVYQSVQKYALTYDKFGNITDLATTHGLGMIYVRRGSGAASSQFTVDLVSYERALPLWRGVVTVDGL